MEDRTVRRLTVVCVLIGALTPTMLFGVAVPVPLVPADFGTILGGAAVAVDVPLVTDMGFASLLGRVVSQAFTDQMGNYAYLYQVINTGAPTNHSIEVFTTSPFFQASEATTVGYLTADAPAGFSVGDQLCAGASIDAMAGPTISFGFPGWLGQVIDPGESSCVLYVLSSSDPGLICGNLINGSITQGEIVGAIPEPACLTLMACGTIGLLARRQRHRQQVKDKLASGQ